jgi:hypothetical protein
MSEVALKPETEKLAQTKWSSALRMDKSTGRSLGTIWVDVDNSPHVPFFGPIVEELEHSGYKVLLTARDCFQVCGLADLLGLSYRRIGRHYGKNTALKLLGLGWRALQLIPTALRERPILAMSHGSRSQLLAANVLRIPSITMADYEFAKIWMLVHPTWVITPEIISDEAIRGRKGRTLKYPGIKEDVYVHNFKPAAGWLASLGLNGTDFIVTVRPPATEAHYHSPESDELFEAVVAFLAKQARVRMIMLPRNERQAADIRTKWSRLFDEGIIFIPNHVVDGLNLIWHSDLVISGGGTMNREAAALGVPVYSIFRGTIGAVDRYLAAEGRLVLIETAEEIPTKLTLVKRRASTSHSHKSATLSAIIQHIVTILHRTYPENGNYFNCS